MSERREAEVAAIIYVGPHEVRPGLFQIELETATPGGGARASLSLIFRPNEAQQLAKMLQALPPRPAEDHLLDAVAGHDT